MNREHLLLICSVLIASILGVTIVRIFTPELFGVPKDLRIVQMGEAKAAFYENIFPDKDLKETDFQLNDPITIVRGQQLFPEMRLLGPHDILGFRNDYVPRIAEVVVIGDSQSYGNNALLTENWPTQLQRALKLSPGQVYNISAGGWSAPQYLYAFKKALYFQPNAVVIAIYTGNDAHESFRTVYGNKFWSTLKPDPKVTLEELPPIPNEKDPNQVWQVQISPELTMSFTPALRYISNSPDNAAIRAGYKIITNVIQEIIKIAASSDVQVYFTIIPTKEMVYRKFLESKAANLRPDYITLVNAERDFIQLLRATVEQSLGRYIDLVTPLSEAAFHDNALYPSNENGHPFPAGYTEIAKQVAVAITSAVKPLSPGGYEVVISKDESWYYIVNEVGLFQLSKPELFKRHGINLKEVKKVNYRTLSGVQLKGVLY